MDPLDAALLDASLRWGDRVYDDRLHMVTAQAGYNPIHTGIHEGTVHPYRESAAYALFLLASGGRERAARATAVLRAVTVGQDTDPDSRTYGIWPYFLEEPLPRMRPPDWNWADFIGECLVLILRRYPGALEEPTRAVVRDSLAHATESIRRRNVSMHYTNIAVKGTFVTMAAAEALDRSDLRAYAADRLRRLAAAIDESGSFAEYNSPTYGWVTMTDLERLRAHASDADALDLATRIRDRYWLHVARHWHPPTGQLAGPMSRCYSTDLAGAPQFLLMLQKATGGRLRFSAPDALPERADSGHTALTEYQCPEPLAAELLNLSTPRQHRERFTASGPQGTTWLEPALALGSVDRGDAWVQRRPLLGYFKGGHLRLRVIKDGYDFASGLVSAVQERRRVLAAVTFARAGGDRHIGLDRITDGRFRARRISVGFEVAGVVRRADWQGPILRVTTASGVRCDLACLAGAWAGQAVAPVARQEAGALWVGYDLLEAPEEVGVDWAQVARAFAIFAVQMAPEGEGLTTVPATVGHEGDELVVDWPGEPPLGLGLSASVRNDPAAVGLVGGAPVPACRLAEALLQDGRAT